MPIIGLGFNSIEARKEGGRVESEVKVNSTPVITNIKEVSVPNIEKKALSLEFEFVTKYDPNFAQISIKGTIMYLAEKNKPILDDWEKKKNLPEKMSLEVLNYLFRRCLLKASIIAEDLQLPAPMPMPRITPKKK